MNTRRSLTLAAHTPGPWAIGPWFTSAGKHVYANIGSGPDRIAAVTVYGRRRDSDAIAGRALRDGTHTRTVPVDVAESNARLISAAPDLLSVVQALLTARADPTIAATDLLDENNPLIDAARDAIAKAIGVQA
jgi:hypothetical protein